MRKRGTETSNMSAQEVQAEQQQEEGGQDDGVLLVHHLEVSSPPKLYGLQTRLEKCLLPVPRNSRQLWVL